jgi:hypothetical protein
MAWFSELGDAVVDMGAPFGAAVTIASDGTRSEGGAPNQAPAPRSSTPPNPRHPNPLPRSRSRLVMTHRRAHHSTTGARLAGCRRRDEGCSRGGAVMIELVRRTSEVDVSVSVAWAHLARVEM